LLQESSAAEGTVAKKEEPTEATFDVAPIRMTTKQEINRIQVPGLTPSKHCKNFASQGTRPCVYSKSRGGGKNPNYGIPENPE
jgi:hypothetical protein